MNACRFLFIEAQALQSVTHRQGNANAGSEGTILEPARNYWRVARADRAAFLIDAADYYRAVRDAIAQARESVFVLGWDIDSRLALIRNGDSPSNPDALPAALGDLLREVVRRRRSLHVHVLVWDFAMIYLLEREWLPHYKLRWPSHHRLHVHMDDQHPPGGCHHQKVVVVDDRVAFVGGLDLTRSRWDTSEHRPDDPRRVDPNGDHYPPFHDVQMMVSGELAGALGDLSRERWRNATARNAVPPAPSGQSDPWPSWVEPAVKGVDVGIARTVPEFDGRQAVREIEELYRDGIRRARRLVFIENQFLTSTIIADALAERLADPEGPEIVIILRLHGGDWLEQVTMDVLRERLLRHLRESDKHGRLGVYYPHCEGMDDKCLGLHSKIAVVDDELVQVGSANLTNRSMRLDTECNLALEARGDDALRAAIIRFRNRLLGEHLGVQADAVSGAVQAEGSLLKGIERLLGRPRTLRPFEPSQFADLEPWVPGGEVLDPERPMQPDLVAAHFIQQEDRQPLGRQLLLVVCFLVGILLLAAAWRWTELGDWLEVDRIQATFHWAESHPATPLVVIGGFVLGGLVVAPVTALVVACLVVFGPLLGFLYAISGSALSGLVTFGIGRALGKGGVRRLFGPRMSRLSKHLSRRGLLSMVVAHMLPVAPFTLVNMAAGALQVRTRDFLIGTVAGMAPGMIALAVLVDRVEAVIRTPDAGTLTILGAATLVLVLGAWGLQRALRRREQQGARAGQE